MILQLIPIIESECLIVKENLKIIDIHHHIIPKVYKDALRKIGVTTAGGYPIKDWKPEDSLNMMNELNINIGVTSISEPATLPFNKKQASKVAREVNEYQAQLKKDYPERFKSFALLPMPHVKQSINEVAYALDELKLDGIGLLSNYGDQYLGDDIFEPVMKAINDRHGVVFVHPSSSSDKVKKPQYVVADFIEEFTFNTSRAATNLILSGTLDRYPNITFILAHAGGTLPYIEWRINQTLETLSYIMVNPKERLKPYLTGSKTKMIGEVAKHPIRYGKMFKTYLHSLKRISQLQYSADDYIHRFYYDTALSTGNSTFASLKEVTDTSHIVFGSDAHYAPNDWIAKMEQDIGASNYFDENEQHQIFNDNSNALLK